MRVSKQTIILSAVLLLAVFAIWKAKGQGIRGIALYQPLNLSTSSQPASLTLVYVSPNGLPTGSGSLASPLNWTTVSTWTNVYVAFITGCYTEFTPTLCITNQYEPPDMFTNSPLSNFPMDYWVEFWE